MFTIKQLKITIFALVAMLFFSCQKSTNISENVIKQNSSCTSYSILVNGNIDSKEYSDYYCLIDADSMIWSLRSFLDDEFLYDFEYVWNTADTDLVSVVIDSINDNLTLIYADETVSTLSSIVKNGNTTSLYASDEDGNTRYFEITMPADEDLETELVCFANGTYNVSVTGSIPEFIRKVIKLFKKYSECKMNLGSHAAICNSHFGCRATVTDLSVFCDSYLGSDCNCSQFNYHCQF